MLLTYWTALAFVSRRAALLAGLMMATSIMLGVEARLAKTDAMLLLTASPPWARWRASISASAGRPRIARLDLPAIFWTALAAGILIKGPLIVMFVGLTVMALAVFDRSVRWLRRSARSGRDLALPSGAAVVPRHRQPVRLELLRRIGRPRSDAARSSAPRRRMARRRVIYFALFWVTFWPGATLAAMAVPSIWAARREKGAKFLLCWIVPAWIVLELVVTKLPHYVLPLYPAIAILIAGVVDTACAGAAALAGPRPSWLVLLPADPRHRHDHLLVMFGRQLACPHGRSWRRR